MSSMIMNLSKTEESKRTIKFTYPEGKTFSASSYVTGSDLYQSGYITVTDMSMEFDVMMPTTISYGNILSLGGSNSSGGGIYITSNKVFWYANGYQFTFTHSITGRAKVKFVCKNGSIRVSINGTVIGTYSGSFVQYTGSYFIGANQSATQEYFYGTLYSLTIKSLI